MNASGIISDIVKQLAAIFRFMFPGVLILGIAYLAYPEWFEKHFDIKSAQHLILLSVIALTVGNTWYVVNRYIVHQAIDLLFYTMQIGGPTRENSHDYSNDLGQYVLSSFEAAQIFPEVSEHIKLRASSVLLILTLGEVLMIAAFWHSHMSILEGQTWQLYILGVIIFLGGVVQMGITRVIDNHLVRPALVPRPDPVSVIWVLVILACVFAIIAGLLNCMTK